MKEPEKRSSERGGQEQGGGSDETELERIDRNLIELLNELRVALPGVQVLFAFLLILPFQQGFTTVTPRNANRLAVGLLFLIVWYAMPARRLIAKNRSEDD